MINGVPFASMTDWVESRRRMFMPEEHKAGEASRSRTPDETLLAQARKVKGAGTFFVTAFVAGP